MSDAANQLRCPHKKTQKGHYQVETIKTAIFAVRRLGPDGCDLPTREESRMRRIEAKPNRTVAEPGIDLIERLRDLLGPCQLGQSEGKKQIPFRAVRRSTSPRWTPRLMIARGRVLRQRRTQRVRWSLGKMAVS